MRLVGDDEHRSHNGCQILHVDFFIHHLVLLEIGLLVRVDVVFNIGAQVVDRLEIDGIVIDRSEDLLQRFDMEFVSIHGVFRVLQPFMFLKVPMISQSSARDRLTSLSVRLFFRETDKSSISASNLSTCRSRAWIASCEREDHLAKHSTAADLP